MPRCYLVKKVKYFGMRDWGHLNGVPPSPSEASVAPNSPSYTQLGPPVPPQSPPQSGYSYMGPEGPQPVEVEEANRLAEVDVKPEITNLDGGIPIFRIRTPEETEIARDLLELSRSLPPKTLPGQTIIFHHHPYGCSASPELTTLLPRQPQTVPEDPSRPTCTPLTPTTSEYSSDAENVCPSEEVLEVGSEMTIQSETSCSSADHSHGNNSSSNHSNVLPNRPDSKTAPVPYTYDELLVTDGRSKRRSCPSHSGPTHIRANPKILTLLKKPSPKNGEERRSSTRLQQQQQNLRPVTRKASSQPPKEDMELDLEDEEEEEEDDEDGDTPRQRYTCSECGKHYATSSNLSRHKQTHRSLDSQNAKRCPTCGKAYVSMPALSMHLLTHNLTHKCDTCGKGFSRPWLLQGHMRSHTGEKPYGCAHCGKAFADRSNLRAHMQTHSAAKNYTCKRCNKSFALKSYLNKHYDSACFKDSSGEGGSNSSTSSAE